MMISMYVHYTAVQCARFVQKVHTFQIRLESFQGSGVEGQRQGEVGGEAAQQCWFVRTVMLLMSVMGRFIGFSRCPLGLVLGEVGGVLRVVRGRQRRRTSRTSCVA